MLANLRNRWLTHHHAFLSQQNIASERMSVTSAWSKVARLMLQSLVLGLGAWLAVKGEITAGMMIAGSILVSRVLTPIDQLIAVSKQSGSAKQAWQRLQHLLKHYPPRRKSMPLPAPVGELSVENLLYRPDYSLPPLLFDIHFSLKRGETLAIVGASGSGKSTLARLLVGALAPTLGCVRLDGADLHQADKESTGPHIGYLPQDLQLFSGTLAENIARFGIFDINDAGKIVTAAKIAGVHELILSLPHGYDTLLGEAGRGLSGGQQQRIALARAVYGIPRFIVLDEPDSSQDSEGDSALSGALDELKKQRCTVIVITHRPALVRHADKLLILKPGHPPCFGPTQQLLRELPHQRPPEQSTGEQMAV